MPAICLEEISLALFMPDAEAIVDGSGSLYASGISTSGEKKGNPPILRSKKAGSFTVVSINTGLYFIVTML
jgi:hypothetical protein